MPTRVLLLRHAETSNPHVFHGAESDIGLSERGIRQSLLVASYLARLNPQVVVSSAMRRAVATALPIAQACGLQLTIVPELHERKVGALSGTATTGPENPWHQTLRRWMAGDTAYTTPGAESFDEVRERVLRVWHPLTLEHQGKTLVVVAHGIVCRVLLLSLLPQYSVADWSSLGPIRNLAIHELIRDNLEQPWQALRINELPSDCQE